MCHYTYHHFPTCGHISSWTVHTCVEHAQQMRFLRSSGHDPLVPQKFPCRRVESSHDLLKDGGGESCAQCWKENSSWFWTPSVSSSRSLSSGWSSSTGQVRGGGGGRGRNHIIELEGLSSEFPKIELRTELLVYENQREVERAGEIRRKFEEIRRLRKEEVRREWKELMRRRREEEERLGIEREREQKSKKNDKSRVKGSEVDLKEKRGVGDEDNREGAQEGSDDDQERLLYNVNDDKYAEKDNASDEWYKPDRRPNRWVPNGAPTPEFSPVDVDSCFQRTPHCVWDVKSVDKSRPNTCSPVPVPSPVSEVSEIGYSNDNDHDDSPSETSSDDSIIIICNVNSPTPQHLTLPGSPSSPSSLLTFSSTQAVAACPASRANAENESPNPFDSTSFESDAASLSSLSPNLEEWDESPRSNANDGDDKVLEDTPDLVWSEGSVSDSDSDCLPSSGSETEDKVVWNLRSPWLLGEISTAMPLAGLGILHV